MIHDDGKCFLCGGPADFRCRVEIEPASLAGAERLLHLPTSQVYCACIGCSERQGLQFNAMKDQRRRSEPS
jgi:hypothetical protein